MTGADMDITAHPAIAEVLQAKAAETRNQVALAVASKQLDSQKSLGQALLGMIDSAATAQKQIAAGHLDVRV